MSKKGQMDVAKKALGRAQKYVREAQRYAEEGLTAAQRISSELTAGAMSSIHKGVEIGQGRTSLTAGELKQVAPTKIDKMEVRLLKLLANWSILDIECLLVHRVIPEAKRRATVPR